MKNVYGVNNPREEVFKEVVETPSQLMRNDAGNKSSAIYHPPVKAGNYSRERQKYKEKCGDVRSIKLGHPMDWPNFLTLSDDTKREYLESVFSKYPGINARTICSIFNSCFRKNEIEAEIRRLGFNFDGADKRYQIQAKIAKTIAAEKHADIEAASKMATKPKHITYARLCELSKGDALSYLNNLYDYYSRSLALKDFSELFMVSEETMKKLMMKVNFDISSWGSSKSTEALFYREIFREEMMNSNKQAKPVKEKTKEPVKVSSKSDPVSEAEKKTENTEKQVESSPKKNDVQINSIGITVDASDIDSIAEVLKSFSGTVRIHIKKA